MVDARTLSAAMGGSLPMSEYERLCPAFNAAMVAANVDTVNRAAMWCAQIGHESAGLRYMEEIADGAQYEGRSDLGNTKPGDGRRFKGSGPIQLTGRANFTRFSQWCYVNGYVSYPAYLADRPELVRSDPAFGFLAASWYWTVARPAINGLCDARDLVGVTRAINGGLNGFDDRSARWNRCLALGAALLPDGGFLMALTDKEQRELLEKIRYVADQIGPKHVAWGEDSSLGKNAAGQELTLRDALAKFFREWKAK